MLIRPLPVLVPLVILLGAAAAQAAAVRMEAEKFDLSKFGNNVFFAPQTATERGLLSGGDWISYGGTEPAEATTRLELSEEEAAKLTELWARDFGGDWQYKIDDGDWLTAAGPRYSSHIVVREPGRFFTAGWRRIGTVAPAKGPRTLTIRRDPATKAHVQFAIDCVELRAVDAPVPRGWWAEGEQAPTDGMAAGWMAFTPSPLEDNPAQLGPENVKPAGLQGRIVRAGSRLAFEKTGEPARLWGVTVAEESIFAMREADLRRLARLLASRGVNFVRVHAAPYSEETPGAKTDGIQRFVAAMKAEGIYIGLDWVCTAADHVAAAWELPGFSGGEGIQNLAYFSEGFRERLRARGRNLLLAPNPHTGVPLGHDPAVGFVMLVDEDSPFFWTFVPEKMPAAFREDIERQFAAWAKKRHGGVEAALAAWGATEAKFLQGVDAPAEGRLALYPAALLGGAPWAASQRNLKRAADQARFMAETARQAYAGLATWLRSEIGYEGLVLGSNWKTADERVLGPLENEIHADVDATARNTYFSPQLTRKSFMPWTPGDVFRSRSLLLEPREALTTHPQAEEFPHLLTEGGYENPNRYRAEEPLVVAAYYALQGVDAYLPFHLEADWNHETSIWPFLTPSGFGQWPAAAYLYRAGYVREGEVVFRDATPLEHRAALSSGLIDVEAGLDEVQTKNAGEAALAQGGSVSTRFDPLAFYVGRVTRDLRAEAKPLVSPALATHIDPGARVVRSVTGELALDWGRGVLTIDAPRAQGAGGFFATVETADAVFTQAGPHGTMVLVSLDGRPLNEAGALLLQVMTEERNLGFATEPAEPAKEKAAGEITSAAERILANGRAPLLVREPAGSVRLKFPEASRLRVTALDFDGRPRADRTVRIAEDGTLTLRPDTLHYRLER